MSSPTKYRYSANWGTDKIPDELELLVSNGSSYGCLPAKDKLIQRITQDSVSETNGLRRGPHSRWELIRPLAPVGLDHKYCTAHGRLNGRLTGQTLRSLIRRCSSYHLHAWLQVAPSLANHPNGDSNHIPRLFRHTSAIFL